MFRAPLDPGEVGACVAGVHLKNTVTGATHPLLAVGTALTAGTKVLLMLFVVVMRCPCL